MGKKSIKPSMKSIPNKQQQIHNLIKILRPKVYITESSNFKKLVQELTGNNVINYSPVVSSPPSSVSITASPSTVDHIQDQENYGLLDLSFDSPCFGAALEGEGSPDDHHLRVPAVDNSFNCVVENSILDSEKIDDFSLQYYMDLESLLIGTVDSVNSYNCDTYNYGMNIHQQEVCVYDYGLSGLI
ncbi:hypothetical protein ACP275_13G048600 [Erythranthe tilingii]